VAENDNEEQNVAGRRRFLTNSGMAIGVGIVGAKVAGCGQQAGGTPDSAAGGGGGGGSAAEGPEPSAEAAPASHVSPGELDEYYGFWSGGHSGEVRVIGIPSMRELKRIPVFNRESATGHGATDFTKQMLGGKLSGDTHHVHLSYDGGTYDGRYAFVNDKASARLARIRLDTFECDHIVNIPWAQGTHGIFPQRHRTGLVFCNSEFRTPLPNDGSSADQTDPSTYGALHTAIDGETMEVRWQVMVEGNMDLCASDYEGKYSFATCYNSEGGVTLPQMMESDLDHLYVFNIEAIEAAVAAGTDTMRLGDSPVPVIDAKGANGQFVLRIPVKKSPHGVNIDPTGRYAVVSGKLDPTASVIDIQKIAQAFAGEIEPAECVVGNPEVGAGPLHTAFDNRGNAYTSIFLDSVVTKWNIADAIAAHGGAEVDPVKQKIDVHYQIGHINASMSETNEADGKWLIALCKFSKDRFLNVGMLHPENDQLIDISGETMRLVHDGPTYPEPHDAVIVTRDKLRPVKITPRTGPRFDMYNAWAQEDGIDLMEDNRVVERPDGSVRVYLTSTAPDFHMADFTVKAGQTVQIVLTNKDSIEDLSHGMCVTHHDVNFLVNAQDTNSMTFTAGSPGVYWYYCPWFCHALHLEMRGRMFVVPA